MPISRARKEELVARYVELLNESNGFILLKSQGLSVPQIEGLRTVIRSEGGQYAVAKNTLIRKALEQSEWVVPENLLEGPIAVVFGRDNMPGVAKAVLKFIKDANVAEQMTVKGGVLTGSVLNTAQVEAVSELPTLDELRAQIIGTIIAPAQGIVNAIYQATGGVVNVLQAYLDKNEGGD